MPLRQQKKHVWCAGGGGHCGNSIHSSNVSNCSNGVATFNAIPNSMSTFISTLFTSIDCADATSVRVRGKRNRNCTRVQPPLRPELPVRPHQRVAKNPCCDQFRVTRSWSPSAKPGSNLERVGLANIPWPTCLARSALQSEPNEKHNASAVDIFFAPQGGT